MTMVSWYSRGCVRTDTPFLVTSTFTLSARGDFTISSDARTYRRMESLKKDDKNRCQLRVFENGN